MARTGKKSQKQRALLSKKLTTAKRKLREKKHPDSSPSSLSNSKYRRKVKRNYERNRLKDPVKRALHNISQRVSQEARLADPEQRALHKKRIISCQKKRLAHSSQHAVHKKRMKSCQKKRLAHSSQHAVHKERMKSCQKKRLAHSSQHAVHKERMKSCQKRRLSNELKRVEQRKRDAASRKRRESSPTRGPGDKIRRRKNQIARLADSALRKRHLQSLIENQRKRMMKASYRKNFLKRVREYQRKRQVDPVARMVHITRVIMSRRRREKEESKEILMRTFTKEKMKGPSHVCECCQRLWWRTSVTNCDIMDLRTPQLNALFAACGPVEGDSVKLCSNCKQSIKNCKMPTFSIKRGLELPYVADVIKKLTELESRFLSPRIPFMSIRAANIDKQYLVKGRAINVPINVDTAVNILPRTLNESKCIPVAFKRKRAFKNNVAFENVRPKVIQDAAMFLEGSPLYQYCNIRFDTSRFGAGVRLDGRGCDSDAEEPPTDPPSDKDDDEEDEPINVADDITMLANATVFAPGEGKKPESLFSPFVESQSFLRIFGGELVEPPPGVTFQTWAKSLIMRSDRRAADVPFLFFLALKLRNSKVSSGINFCLRKSKNKCIDLNVGQALDAAYLQNLEIHDSGYKIFASDRGSPAFWEGKKKEVFGMIRQLGPPTIFLTLSPSETRWLELLIILKEVIDGETLSDTDASSLPYAERVRLVKSDPVTVARYFDYRIRRLFHLLLAKDSVFEEHQIEDYYIRTEFQQRGSPHVHCILWLKGAPKYDEFGNNNESVEFIDKFISCSALMPESRLLQLQSHKHTFTCKRTKDQKCRFDMPFMPMRETAILKPITADELDEAQKKALKKQRNDIKDTLTEIVKNDLSTTLDDILDRYKLSYDQYILIVRSGLKRVTVYLRRSPQEAMINFYNPDILQLHEANMDIQFITDMYSCATYVLDYLNKANKTMSKLLREIEAEVRNGNYTMAEQFRKLGSSFLNGSEFSGQEAVYYILGMPLSKCSRSCVFVNTNPPEKRVAVLKRQNELQQLRDADPNSRDVFAKSAIDHYAVRPLTMESVCLADFVALYNYSKRSSRVHQEPEDDDSSNDEELAEPAIALQNNAGFLKRRAKAKIIRFVNYNAHDDDDFKRENVMLFYPWRDEAEMIENAELTFANHKDVIQSNRTKYIFNEDIMDEISKAQARRDDESADESVTDSRIVNSLQIFNAVNSANENASDPDMKIGKPKDSAAGHDDVVHIPVPHIMPDDEYVEIVCTLNEKQRIFLHHVLYSFRHQQTPIYHCVIGGAGVGKSRLIAALDQAIARYLNSSEGCLDTLKVLLCAPTGKAAFGIRGTTLHAAFSLTVNQNSDQSRLSSATRNSLYSKLRNVKLIIIDEISMVGARLMGKVNERLQEIFSCNDVPFAGISIIVFGDFNQLGPIGDKFIFQFPGHTELAKILINPLWDLFTAFSLTEIMRQKGDGDFAEALNNFAKGLLTKEQISLFQQRVVKDINDIPKEAVRLYMLNANVNRYNDSIIDPDKNKVIIEAEDKVSGQPNESVKKKLLEQAREAPHQKTQGMPFALKLSIGVKYMVTVNIDTSDGLVNGAIGTLEDIEELGDEVIRVWLLFPQIEVGKKRRREITHAIKSALTAVDKQVRNIRLGNSKYSVIRKQFPLTPAEAISIHKSQGGTYDQVAVDIIPRMQRSHTYVALSRCTKLSGLYITGVFRTPQPPSKCDPVLREVERLQRHPVKILNKTAADFQDQNSIVYHNVQSIHNDAHRKDLRNCLKITQPTIFIAAETRTVQDDDIHMDGYSIPFRSDVRMVSHVNGVTIWCRNGYDASVLFSYANDRETESCRIVSILFNDLVVCSGYKPPFTSYSSVRRYFMDCLDIALKNSQRVILLGDFNIDVAKEAGHTFFKDLLNYGLTNQLPVGTVTTNGSTAIDVVFASFPCFATTSESLYSYHNQLLVVPDASVANLSNSPVPQERQSSLPCTHPSATIQCPAAPKRRKNLPLKAKKPTKANEKTAMATFLKRILKELPKNQSINNNYNCQQDISSWPNEIVSNFIPLQTTGDGNCFYHAVSLLLCGNESLTCQLRKLMVAHLEINLAFLDELPLTIAIRDNEETYLQAVKTDGNYAEITEVLFMAYILQIGIVVYICNGSSVNTTEFADDVHYSFRAKFHIALQNQHYTALMPRAGASIPIPPLARLLPPRALFRSL